MPTGGRGLLLHRFHQRFGRHDHGRDTRCVRQKLSALPAGQVSRYVGGDELGEVAGGSDVERGDGLLLIFHGFAEESLVRVIAQRASHHSFGALAGIAAAAICFGGLQALQGYLDVWNIVNGILFGACLGFLALGPGGIWTAIGAHAGWSWLEIAALGQPGQIVKSGHWMGGTGPDSYGSPIFTLVLLAALGLQIVLHLRRQKRSI